MFEVIKGGLLESHDTSVKEFDMAYVTDTRLMGVVMVGIRWLLPENDFMNKFYQFFFLDCEEFGLDTYKSFVTSGDDDEFYEMLMAERDMLGGLGCKKVPASEREVKYLIQTYYAFTKNRMLPLPENSSEFEDLLTPELELNRYEIDNLMEKICVPVNTEYEAINYFIMRCAGRDFEAAKYLTKHYVRTDLFPNFKEATLLRNEISEVVDDDSGVNSNYYKTDSDSDFGTFMTRKCFRCESLIEFDGKYHIIVTALTLEGLKIVKYERISQMRISDIEAGMIVAKSEFVTLCQLAADVNDIDVHSTEMLERSMVTEHPSGRLFMIFYPDNSHVDRRVFTLNGDVEGIYFVTDSGQIILAAYSREGINTLERDLMKSHLGAEIIPLSKYEFKEPVLFEFANSGMEDFEEFVDLISETDE